MKPNVLAFALLLALPVPALAFHCPADIAKIDELLAANPDLPGEVRGQVMELRNDGQRLHDDGKHGTAVDVLAEALLLLDNAI